MYHHPRARLVRTYSVDSFKRGPAELHSSWIADALPFVFLVVTMFVGSPMKSVGVQPQIAIYASGLPDRLMGMTVDTTGTFAEGVYVAHAQPGHVIQVNRGDTGPYDPFELSPLKDSPTNPVFDVDELGNTCLYLLNATSGDGPDDVVALDATGTVIPVCIGVDAYASAGSYGRDVAGEFSQGGQISYFLSCGLKGLKRVGADCTVTDFTAPESIVSVRGMAFGYAAEGTLFGTDRMFLAVPGIVGCQAEASGILSVDRSGDLAVLADSSQVGTPFALAFSPPGTGIPAGLYVADVGTMGMGAGMDGRVLRITPDMRVEVVANGFIDPVGLLFLPEEETMLVLDDGSGKIIEIPVVRDVALVEEGVPPMTRGQQLRIKSSSPNPGGGDLRLSFAACQLGRVSLKVLDVSGRLVHSRDLGLFTPGDHMIELDLGRESGLKSGHGVYFIHLSSGAGSDVTKMTVLQE